MITDTLIRAEISADEEKELIRQAQEKATLLGHSVPTAAAQQAKEKLIAAYSPVINRMAKVQGLDWDELESALIEAFLRAIEEYDFTSGNRLSHELRFRFMAVTRQLQTQQVAFSIPSATRALFYSILYRHAGGSWTKALEILDEFEMTRETFVAAGEALHGVESLAHVDRFNEAPMWLVDVPDYELVEFVRWLRDGLNERERLVVDLHFGFDEEDANALRLSEGYDEQDDLTIPQVAAVTNTHLRTTWRIRAAALDKMRGMINVDGD